MKKVLVTYEGILADTFFADACAWYVARTALVGKDDKITMQTLTRIAQDPYNGNSDLREEIKKVIETRSKEINLAKKSVRKDTKDWRHYGTSGILHKNELFEEDVLLQTKSIANKFRSWFADPIEGNCRFFQALYEAMSTTYDESPLGIVTDLSTNELENEFYRKKTTKDGNGEEYQILVFGSFPFFESTVGARHYKRGFPFAECIGDNAVAYQGATEEERIKIAYHILCGKLNVRPEETIAFVSGEKDVAIISFNGIRCVCVEDPEREAEKKEELFRGELIVRGSLEQIATGIPFIVGRSPKEALEKIAQTADPTKVNLFPSVYE